MDIDKISKELYEYIVSKPYGTEVSTSKCLSELYNFKGEYIDQHVGWILTNGELKLSDTELFDIDAKLHKLIKESGKYFIDSTMYVGACVGLPFNVGGILKTYDGLVDEFKRRKTKDFGGYYVKGPVKGGWHQRRYLVRIPPRSQLRLKDFGKLEHDIDPLFWGINYSGDIKQGTKFVVVKIGEGICGMVMSGFVMADTVYDERNRRDCRKYYKTDSEVVLCVMEMFHPDRSNIILLDNLKRVFPNTPFDGSVNEVYLSEEESTVLCDLVDYFHSVNKDIFKPLAGRRPSLTCP